MCSIQAHLEPLAIANNIAQASYTRFDHILLTLGNLFHVYGDHKLDALVRASLQNSLEKRWRAADQQVAIFTTWANPYIWGRPFNGNILPQALLVCIAMDLFKQVYGREANLDFWEACTEYHRCQGQFSDENMALLFVQQACKKEVRRVVSLREACLQPLHLGNHFLLSRKGQEVGRCPSVACS